MTEHLITKPVEPILHTRCGAVVLDGWAEGIHARVDPVALNRGGELAAILAGRRTFVLTRNGLVERDVDRIRHPVGPVLAAHKCGLAVPPEHRAPVAPIVAALESEGFPF